MFGRRGQCQFDSKQARKIHTDFAMPAEEYQNSLHTFVGDWSTSTLGSATVCPHECVYAQLVELLWSTTHAGPQDVTDHLEAEPSLAPELPECPVRFVSLHKS